MSDTPSLPETIWWCAPHNTCGSSYGCQFGREDDCRMVEVELHPVGSRVAGRDLVIRREDEVWVETGGVWLNRIFYLQPGKYAIRQLESYDAAVDAALAAAEGGEE